MTAAMVAVLGAAVLVVALLAPARWRGRAAPRARGLAAGSRAAFGARSLVASRSAPRDRTAPSAGGLVAGGGSDQYGPTGPRPRGLVPRGRAASRTRGLVARGSAAPPPRGPDPGGQAGPGTRGPATSMVAVRRRAPGRADARLRAARAEAAPAMIDLLGACLRAGLNPYLAICRVAERSPATLRPELDRAVADLRLGRSPGAALLAVAERTGLDEFRAAASALEAADRWGMGPAEALAARAEALRGRRRFEAEAEAGRAAVRLAFPLVLCFLPAFALVVVVPTVAGAVRALVP
jgi:Type II secretion system (T2SS), protein F